MPIALDILKSPEGTMYMSLDRIHLFLFLYAITLYIDIIRKLINFRFNIFYESELNRHLLCDDKKYKLVHINQYKSKVNTVDNFGIILALYYKQFTQITNSILIHRQ